MSDDVVVKETPVGEENSIINEKDPNVLIKKIVDARDSSERKAGLVKIDDNGGILDAERELFTIPTEGLREYKTKVCDCECHLKNKRDCMNCYDHPQHLEENRKLLKRHQKNTK